MPQETDRWLIDGDCKKCRRMEYCAKPCTANKRRVREMIRDFILKKTGLDDVKQQMEAEDFDE